MASLVLTHSIESVVISVSEDKHEHADNVEQSTDLVIKGVHPSSKPKIQKLERLGVKPSRMRIKNLEM